MNNDGFADIIVGAPKTDDLRDAAKKLIDAGSVTVLSGETLEELTVFYGENKKAYAGTAVATGDIDINGVTDIVYGIKFQEPEGTVDILLHSPAMAL